MRQRYRYIEHTADVEFVAYGASIEELFSNALLAMFDTGADTKKVSAQKSRQMRILLKESSESAEDLLWSALQDSLSIASAKGAFAYKVSELSIEETKKGYSLKAVILGKKATTDAARLDVKGVSKYDLGIRKKGRNFEASVVLDV